MRPSTLKYAILSVLLALFSVGIFWYVTHRIGNLKESSALLGSGIAQERVQEESLKKTKALLSDVEGGGLETYVLGGDKAASFIGDIEDFARVTKFSTFEVGSVSVNQPPTTPLPSTMEELRLSGEGSGTWSSVMRFLALLESLPLPVSFSQVSLERTNADKGASLWNVAFVINVVKFK